MVRKTHTPVTYPGNCIQGLSKWNRLKVRDMVYDTGKDSPSEVNQWLVFSALCNTR